MNEPNSKSNFVTCDLPKIPIFGHQIRWTIPGLGRQVASVFGYPTRHAAIADAVRYARSLGWTPARWWEFWRWGDTKTLPGYITSAFPKRPSDRPAAGQNIKGK